MARIPPSMSIETEMECGRKEVVGSQTLQRIAEQLQWYKTPSLIEELENVTGRNMGSKFGIMDHVEGENGLFTHANWRKRRAAVLICLFEGKQGELRVILTKRSMKLSSHPGDVALPGGKMEEGDDDDSATALREAMEEIGLDSYLVQVVAKLEPFISQVDNHRCEERAWKSWKYVFHCFDCETEQGAFTICGLTASILIRAASVVYQQIPCFSSNLPDFQQLQRALSNAA
ncbi:PREDICTED: nudix hydrolase 15, mitochondrial isoform X2 [Theobroma cacao]|uniref:Nudix hydrolase 15, mitochondrial isoform X2 n=1 Tax=Theobroma cacao TaxID=3641 RepID=A0AB32WES3_THECC|nr:PREDICTED: nudix hydrolase 15, mitochondrial isoform X2 [Theobroma cacao]